MRRGFDLYMYVGWNDIELWNSEAGHTCVTEELKRTAGGRISNERTTTRVADSTGVDWNDIGLRNSEAGHTGVTEELVSYMNLFDS